MNDGLKNRFLKFLTGSTIVAIIAIGVIVVVPTFQRSQALKNREAELNSQIEAKKHEIAVLVENQKRFRSDRDFVEQIARQNRRVFPGELVFVFEDK